MQLRESTQNTKSFFQKTIKNLKSFIIGGYQKLPQPPLLNPFCCTSGKHHQTDQFYTTLYNERDSDSEREKSKRNNSVVITSKEPMQEEDACSGSFKKLAKQFPVKNKQEGRRKEGKHTKSHHIGKREEQSSKRMNGVGGQALAQKMKDLEMMDVSDVDHELDIEEALHYYSRLKSPVYLDLVDKFFTDLYSDFSVPQASVSKNNSKRRSGSMRL
ncbi:hypothetical protein CFOL_v3_08002 [Cephalotus follicularis]|uniref:Uncharacterized protein n=1 Tax=Cephalotus follicularis TaxID=3775 RepID=A0A1Q3B9F3_CEPFO|nr:hypothetical protein CFOL_v3_08002 [Cephalotus follicularis]